MKINNKVLSIFLVIVFVFAFSYTAFAENSTVTVALESEPSRLNPINYEDYVTLNILSTICDPLIAIDERGNFTTEGAVLEDYSINKDGKEFIFEVREGITFHNGDKLTAEDVKFTYESLMDEELGSPHRNYYEDIEKIELIDEFTLKITLQEPNVIFMATSRLRDTVLPKNYIEEVGWDGYEQNPVGSGPYKFVEHKPGEKIVLEAYEDYWNKKAEIENVEFVFISETSSALMALETKEIDFMDLPISAYERLKEDEGNELNFKVYDEFTDARIAFNKRPDSIFSDVRLRQAVAYAINAEDIVDLQPGDFVKPAVGRIPDTHAAFSPDINSFEYNPEKAKELMAEAGYPDGFSTEIYVSSGNEERILETQIIQQHLAEVGIDLEIVTLEWGTYLDVTAEGDAPMFRENWPCGTLPSPYNFVAEFHSENSYNPIFGTYYNEEVDSLIDEIKRTPDPDNRWELYRQVQMITMEDVATYPLYWPISIQGYNNELDIPESLFNVFRKPTFHINEWSFK
ncbi:MAG: ABC transporter substrate-binding protein [Halarsenatibacteraceae bacterium]